MTDRAGPRRQITVRFAEFENTHSARTLPPPSLSLSLSLSTRKSAILYLIISLASSAIVPRYYAKETRNRTAARVAGSYAFRAREPLHTFRSIKSRPHYRSPDIVRPARTRTAYIYVRVSAWVFQFVIPLGSCFFFLLHVPRTEFTEPICHLCEWSSFFPDA